MEFTFNDEELKELIVCVRYALRTGGACGHSEEEEVKTETMRAELLERLERANDEAVRARHKWDKKEVKKRMRESGG